MINLFAQKWLFSHFSYLAPGWTWDQKFFIHAWLYTTGSYAEKILEFAPPISDICQLHHFWIKLSLQFSKLNISPSVRPNLANFLNFWNWIYLPSEQIIIIGEKTQFGLNLMSFKLSWDYNKNLQYLFLHIL